MPTNIEIKAKLHDPHRAIEIARRLSGTEGKEIRQRDTFFVCPNGRLKLRELSENIGELIFYRRENVASTKQSDYSIAPTDRPGALVSLLSNALGVKGVVSKWRALYMIGQTRVHIDAVESIGSFLELEVVLHPGQSVEEGHAIARHLMHQLQLTDADLIEGSYLDLQNSGHGA